MHNTVEKSSKINRKKGSLGEFTTMNLHPTLHKTLNKFDANQKANKK
jgi:hypothetical protein